MQRGWKTLLPVAILAAVVAYLYVQQHAARVPAPPPVATAPRS